MNCKRKGFAHLQDECSVYGDKVLIKILNFLVFRLINIINIIEYTY